MRGGERSSRVFFLSSCAASSLVSSTHLSLLPLQGVCVPPPQAVGHGAECEEERGDEERPLLLRHAAAAAALPAGLARPHAGTRVSRRERWEEVGEGVVVKGGGQETGVKV